MNHARFLAEIIDDPSNDAAKLVYADWLEEQGDSRAKFLRVVVEGRNGQEASAEEIALAAGIPWRESYLQTIRESDLPPELFVSFGLDCAERLLPLFDKSRPVDVQTRKHLEAARDNQDNALHLLSRLGMYFGETPHVIRIARHAAEGSLDALEEIADLERRQAPTERRWQNPTERRWQIIRLGEYKLWGQPLGLWTKD